VDNVQHDVAGAQHNCHYPAQEVRKGELPFHAYQQLLTGDQEINGHAMMLKTTCIPQHQQCLGAPLLYLAASMLLETSSHGSFSLIRSVTETTAAQQVQHNSTNAST